MSYPLRNGCAPTPSSPLRWFLVLSLPLYLTAAFVWYFYDVMQPGSAAALMAMRRRSLPSSMPAATKALPGRSAARPRDFTRREGDTTVDAFTERLRHVAALGNGKVPMWVILQTHGGTRDFDPNSPDVTTLHEPAREEVRLQYWLALGEGVPGIFWCTYSTQQFWTGLRAIPSSLRRCPSLAAGRCLCARSWRIYARCPTAHVSLPRPTYRRPFSRT